MSWRDRLTRAAWRGFEFLTEAHEARGGRRLVVHEFPGAEAPLVEDLGGKAWDYKLNAYFIGPDYDLERNRFLDLLNQAGPEWLMHPWLGEVWVRPRSWSLAESNKDGGFCTVSVEFVPGGGDFDLARRGQATDFTDRTGWAWGVSPDPVDLAATSIRTLGDSAVDDFALAPMTADGMTGFVAAVHARLEKLRQVLSLAALPLTWAGQAQGLITGIKGDLAALMRVPGEYAAALRGLAHAMGLDADGDDLAGPQRAALVARLASQAAAPAPSIGAVNDPAVATNLVRAQALQSALLLTAAAGVALADYRAEQDRDGAVAALVQAIDGLLPSMSDPVFQAAVSMRAALLLALDAQELQPTVVRTVVRPMPAVVLAYQMGVDEADLLARNTIRHPLFCQGEIHG